MEPDGLWELLPTAGKASRDTEENKAESEFRSTPLVADRIGQQVVKARIEGELEGLFHPDSYGYRLNKSAADAVAVTRERCWKYDWCGRVDIRRAFRRTRLGSV